MVSSFDERAQKYAQEEADLDEFTGMDFALVLNQFGLGRLIEPLSGVDPPVKSLESFSEMGNGQLLKIGMKLELPDETRCLVAIKLIRKGVFSWENHKNQCSLCDGNIATMLKEYSFPQKVIDKAQEWKWKNRNI